MFLHALATATPPAAYTQMECWDIVQRSVVRSRLHRRSALILHSILKGDHGITTRHFAVPEITRVFDLTPDELNAAFRSEAPKLAGRALTAALAQAGVRADELDALLICTCTGYLCPGLTSYVAEQLGLRPNTFLQDLVGLGCGAAIPTLRAASHVIAANPDAVVACVAVEICSAAFYLDDDPGVLISACLFSDGAAATIWRGKPAASGLRAFGFDTVHIPADRDKLRFEQRDGKLRNLLDRTVPQLAAGAVEKLWRDRGSRPVSRVVAHPGGRDVLEAVAPVVAPYALTASAETLREYGNMSSPSVLFALERSLRDATPDQTGDVWLVSFGAGFSAHSCRIGVQ
jgi:predicted naringenin-chalcone synthase